MFWCKHDYKLISEEGIGITLKDGKITGGSMSYMFICLKCKKAKVIRKPSVSSSEVKDGN